MNRSSVLMKAKRAFDRQLYGTALRIARHTKDRYYRKTIEMYNTDLIGRVVDDWDENSRAEGYRSLVVPYWEKYGWRPDRFWFELAGSRDHRMDPRFIPSDLYYMELLPYMNNLPFRFALEDKNYLELRFPDVKQARTVCRRIAGEYYDPGMELISAEEGIRLCAEHGGRLFIKPSTYSACGKGIQRFDPSACTEEDIRDLFLQTGANFIVQEEILPHEAISSLNPDSVSTIRVLSLFADGRVYIPNMYLRVSAAPDSHVVVGSEYNAEILPDGRISPMVCLDEGGWFDNREEGLFDAGTVIPGVDRILAETKELHPRVGHIKWIGWDFTVDRDGDPVLIEFNSTPGDHAQRVCGRPLFGEMTDWLLDDYFSGRSMEDYQVRGSWTTNENINKYME